MRRLLSIQNLSMSNNKKKGVPVIETKAKSEQKSDEGPLKTDKFGNICIKILAKPGAKQNSITEISSEGVGVQIAAPPTDGEANAELVKYLSKVLNLRKSDLSLDKGSRSRNKIILVSKGVITESCVIDLLSKECDS